MQIEDIFDDFIDIDDIQSQPKNEKNWWDRIVDLFFPKNENSKVKLSTSNPEYLKYDLYAQSILASSYINIPKTSPPYQEHALIGQTHQSTIHVHTGIKNSYKEVKKAAKKFSKNLEQQFAIKPHQLHSASFIKGGIEVLIGKVQKIEELAKKIIDPIDLIPDVSKKLLNVTDIQKSIDYVKDTIFTIGQNILFKNNPNLKQVHVTFSNAGFVFNEALKTLPKEIKDTVICITAGTTHIIPNQRAHRVYNLIGSEDLPSKLCVGSIIGLNIANRSSNIEEIEQKSALLFGGHFFLQEEYQLRIKEIIEKEIQPFFAIY
jgi:hypothetical protein